MRQELAQHFGIGLGAAGLLMSLGAVVLCISSPQAASTITLVVEERHKPAAIAMALGLLCAGAAWRAQGSGPGAGRTAPPRDRRVALTELIDPTLLAAASALPARPGPRQASAQVLRLRPFACTRSRAWCILAL